MSHLFQLLGLAGIGVSCSANVPQILHLIKEHCSAGVSPRAWTLWFLGSLLIGAYAVSKADKLFIAVQIVNAGAAGTILVLARRYSGMRCAAHRHWDDGGPGD